MDVRVCKRIVVWLRAGCEGLGTSCRVVIFRLLTLCVCRVLIVSGSSRQSITVLAGLMLGLTLLSSCRLSLKLPSSTEIEDDPEMDRDTKVWPPYYLDTDKYNTIRPRPDLVLIVRRPDRFDLGFRIRQRAPQNYPSLQQIYLKFDVGLSIAKRRVNAVYNAFSCNPYDRDSNPDDWFKYLLKRGLLTGSGFWKSLATANMNLRPSSREATGDEPVDGMATMALQRPQSLPCFSVVDNIHHTPKELCLGYVVEGLRDELMNILPWLAWASMSSWGVLELA